MSFMGSVLCRHEHVHCKHFPHHHMFENQTVAQKWNDKDVERVVIACLPQDLFGVEKRSLLLEFSQPKVIQWVNSSE